MEIELEVKIEKALEILEEGENTSYAMLEELLKQGKESDAIQMLEMAISIKLGRAALKKTIPVKPIEYKGNYYKCPVCEHKVLDKRLQRPDILTPRTLALPYCLGCGQRLNWNGVLDENITIDKLRVGQCFRFRGFTWIVLDVNIDGGVMAIMTKATGNFWCESFDGRGCNDYAYSNCRRKLARELMPILGANNLMWHEIDLKEEYGDQTYGKLNDRVFILTINEYRKYQKYIPPYFYRVLTCTPAKIREKKQDGNVMIVEPDGRVDCSHAANFGYIIPVCVFKPKTKVIAL